MDAASLSTIFGHNFQQYNFSPDAVYASQQVKRYECLAFFVAPLLCAKVGMINNLHNT